MTTSGAVAASNGQGAGIDSDDVVGRGRSGDGCGDGVGAYGRGDCRRGRVGNGDGVAIELAGDRAGEGGIGRAVRA